MGKNKVPPTYSERMANHDPDLHWQVENPDGSVVNHFEQHPNGNRRQRRYRQRHHPYYTKPAHKGRDWWQQLNG